ncbi:MAG: hypothetical protein COA91_01770 [Robiginitomaculum sp.]|nr:MAG: hypothetical protein COA91_01770 [Robiginitomaculum sp.]
MMPALLEWDTRFFGFKVAKLQVEQHNDQKLDHAINAAKNMGVSLLSYLCPVDSHPSVPENMELVERRNLYGFDIGQMQISDIPTEPYPLEIYTDTKPTAQFDRLAVTWGKSSRFFKDPIFPRLAAEAMYVYWMRAMLKRDGEEHILIARDSEGEISGITSGRVNENRIGTPLMMVVEKSLFGLNVGPSFVIAHMRWLKQQRIKHAEIITHNSNRLACRIYEKLGWELQSQQDIYHIWLKPPTLKDNYL